MKREHMEFLNYVAMYVKEYPGVSAYVSDYVAQGVNESRIEALNRAADMEVALSVAIAKRYKCRDELILSKLKKWENKSAIKWESTIKMLEEKR